MKKCQNIFVPREIIQKSLLDSNNLLSQEQQFELQEEEELHSGILSSSFMEYLNRIQSRKIYLFGEIVQENILSVIYQINVLESIGNEDIELVINSGGGFVTDCFALIDVMDSSECDFKVTVLGMAASAACLIASNGNPGKRSAGRNSEFMFHEIMQVWGEIHSSNIPYITEEVLRSQKKFTKIFSRNTGKSVKMIESMFYGKVHMEKFMTAIEARKFGIIDKVLKQKKRNKKCPKRII